MKKIIAMLMAVGLIVILLLSSVQGTALATQPAAVGTLVPAAYLPLVITRSEPVATVRTVNAYYSNVANVPNDAMHEMSIVWFGKVTNTESYADVRVGYNNANLYVRVGVIDRWLHIDPAESGQNLEQWDAFTLLLSLDGTNITLPNNKTHRMVVEFSGNNSNPMEQFYSGNGSGWVANPALMQSVVTKTSYRGTDLVNNIDIRGWSTQYTIPFSSLGLSGKPADGSVWGMGMILHDRDSAAGPPLAVKTWPETTLTNRPDSWGWLRFGVPGYTPPASSSPQTTTIRRGLNGAWVPDGDVGGSGECGDMVDWRTDWASWGNFNQAFERDLNIANEALMEHWPCYSKMYINFPLTAIPQGKVIRSAKLRMYQFGGADPTQAYDSLIQVLTVAEDWTEAGLTWNSAPMAMENVSRGWAQVLPGEVACPGAVREWDVSRAAAMAYAKGDLLRLALYSPDAPQHTGKYFYSSDSEDCDTISRPTLIIEWGNP